MNSLSLEAGEKPDYDTSVGSYRMEGDIDQDEVWHDLSGTLRAREVAGSLRSPFLKDR